MMPNEVMPRTTGTIAVLIPQRCKERAQPSNNSATCIINGSDPAGGKNTTRRYEFPLLVLTALDSGSSHIGRVVSV